MTGIGQSKMKSETKSEKAQQYFNQGLNLLHDFWDFEAYRAFKEAIRQDATAVMPYWGLSQAAGEGSVYKSVKQLYWPHFEPHRAHARAHLQPSGRLQKSP